MLSAAGLQIVARVVSEPGPVRIPQYLVQIGCKPSKLGVAVLLYGLIEIPPSICCKILTADPSLLFSFMVLLRSPL